LPRKDDFSGQTVFTVHFLPWGVFQHSPRWSY
jgi:hypothetical protein